MKFLIVFVALFAVAIAAPTDKDVQVVHNDVDVQPESYKFVSETSDGTKHVSEGQVKDVGSDHEANVVHGSYSHVGPDGVTYTVTYVADENGFQPSGAHLPVAPQ